MTRMAFVLFALLAFCFCGASAALAEGRCPPGYFPVGDIRTAYGCAPIPGYGSDGGAQVDGAESQRPRGKWKTTWGAIAWSPENGIGAAALDQYFSKRKAEAGALKLCAELGGVACVVSLAFYDQCAATARNDVVIGFGHALRTEQAQDLAMSSCIKSSERNGVDGTCEITWTGCAVRVYVPRL
jgi:hypothetical protein